MLRVLPGDRNGFSLIEIAIVLVIAGILMAAAVWRSGPAIVRARVSRAASVIAADLQYAQAMAARQRRPVAVIVTPSVRAYVIRDAAGPTVFRQRFLGSDTDYHVEALAVTPSTTLDIFPNGMTRQSTTLTVGLGGRQRQVRITRAGQIRVLP